MSKSLSELLFALSFESTPSSLSPTSDSDSLSSSSSACPPKPWRRGAKAEDPGIINISSGLSAFADNDDKGELQQNKYIEYSPTDFKNIQINGLCSDSRVVKPGDLFCAYPGVDSDGRDYIEQAITQGAVAVLYDPKDIAIKTYSTIPCIAITDLQKKLSELAACFYDYPSKKLSIIAVTGTNGKTTVCHFVAQLAEAMGISCAVLGTLGNGVYPELNASGLTSLGAIDLQRHLAEFVEAQVPYVVLEASSHGLDQYRLLSLEVDVAVLTNLSRDHLDYHKTMDNYQNAKLKLFTDLKPKAVVLNADDEFSEIIKKQIKPNTSISTYSINNKADHYISDIDYLAEGLAVALHTGSDSTKIKLNFYGDYNLSNLLAAELALNVARMQRQRNTGIESSVDYKKRGAGFTPHSATLHDGLQLTLLESLCTPCGRLEAFAHNERHIFVDYAHTPDALEKTLQVLRPHCKGRLICVFGCGGDRDQGKRALMGKVAEQYAEQIILTNDNPRFEDAEKIITDIKQGLSTQALNNKVSTILDRKAAITQAWQQAKQNDFILIAGKGHEDYQLINGQRLAFSDILTVKQLME